MSSSTSSSERLRFLALLACFLAALLVFDRGLSLAVRAIEHRSYGKSDFEQRLGRYLAGRNPAVLVFGTSRTFEGIIPAHLESCLGKKIFKEAYWGKGPKYNYYFYQLYKKRVGVPKLVIYGVDYFIYNAESNVRWMSRFNLGEKAAGFDVLAGPLLLFKNKKHNDEFLNNLMTDLGRTAPAADSGGDEDLFDKINTHPGAPAPDDNPKLRTERPPQFSSSASSRRARRGLFLAFWMSLRKPTAESRPWSRSDYIGSLRTNWQMPGFHRHLQDLSRRYENVTLLVYNTPRDFDLDKPELFLDGGYGKTNSHLSQRGAAVLGRKLCRDLAPLSR